MATTQPLMMTTSLARPMTSSFPPPAAAQQPNSTVSFDVDFLYSQQVNTLVVGESPAVTCFNSFLRDQTTNRPVPCKLFAIPGQGMEIRLREPPNGLFKGWYWNQIMSIKFLGPHHYHYNNVLVVTTNNAEIHIFNVILPAQAVNMAVQLNAFLPKRAQPVSATAPLPLTSTSRRPTSMTTSLSSLTASLPAVSTRQPSSPLSVEADHLYSFLPREIVPGESPAVTCFNTFLRDPEARPMPCKILAIPRKGIEIYNRDPPQQFLEGWLWNHIIDIKYLGPDHYLYNNVVVIRTFTEFHLFNVALPVQAVNVATELNAYLPQRAQSLTSLGQTSPRASAVSPSRPLSLPPPPGAAVPPSEPQPNSPSSSGSVSPGQTVPVTKHAYRIRVERDLEAEVLNKCLDEMEYFAEQRLVQYYSALNEYVSLKQRTSELQAKLTNKKKKGLDKSASENEIEQLEARINQLKPFLDAIVPTPEVFTNVIQKIRLAFMLLTRLERYLRQTLPPGTPFEMLASGLMDRFLEIASQANSLHQPPFAILNAISMPLFTREDVKFVTQLVEQKGETAQAIWTQLNNEHWKTAVEDWQGEIPFYKPRFHELPEPIVLRFLDPAVIREWISEFKLREVQNAAAQARMEPGLQQRFRQQLLAGNKQICRVIDSRCINRKVHLLVEYDETLEIIADEGNDARVRNVDGETGIVPERAIVKETPKPDDDNASAQNEEFQPETPENDELDGNAQLAFRGLLVKEGKRVGVIVKDAENFEDQFRVKKGEIVEILSTVGVDDVRVRKMNDQVGVVPSETVQEKLRDEAVTQPNYIPRQQPITSAMEGREAPTAGVFGLDPTRQNAFKNKLLQEGKRVCFVTNSAAIDRHLALRQGEVLQFLNEIGAESQVRTVGGRLILVPTNSITIMSSTRSDRSSLSLQGAAVFKDKLEREGKRFGIAVGSTKDPRTGEIIVCPGEVLEILEDVNNTQILVSNCFGQVLTVKTITLMIPKKSLLKSASGLSPQQFGQIIRQHDGRVGRILASFTASQDDEITVRADDCVEIIGQERGSFSRVIAADNSHGYIPSRIVRELPRNHSGLTTSLPLKRTDTLRSATSPRSSTDQLLEGQNALVVQRFKATSEKEISVEPGEWIEVLGIGEGYARVITPSQKVGLVPISVFREATRPPSKPGSLVDFDVYQKSKKLSDQPDSPSLESQQRDFARKVKTTNGILCRVLQDFTSPQDRLSVRKGEFVEAHSKQNDLTKEPWVLVSNYANDTGYVPGRILERVKLTTSSSSTQQNTYHYQTAPLFLENSLRSTRSDNTDKARTTTGRYSAYQRRVPGTSKSLFPKRKSNYTDIQKIVIGTFGGLTLVTRKRDKKTLVIKEVLLDGIHDEIFRTKATFLAKYPHQHFVEVMGFFEENDKIYVETPDYYEMGTIRKAINKKSSEQDGRFAEEEIKKWMLQLAKALQHLHSYEIVHRDIRAENVFLTSDNDVKLGDLNAVAEESSTKELVKAATADGTLAYIAPEMCSGQLYDKKVDIWAVGVLAYFLATLSLPFGEDISIVTKLIRQQRPQQLPSSYSHDLVTFVDHLLTFDPIARPNIRQVLTAERFLTNDRR